jgi:hypothetical protein
VAQLANSPGQEFFSATPSENKDAQLLSGTAKGLDSIAGWSQRGFGKFAATLRLVGRRGTKTFYCSCR